ncbi:MAG TPA: DUF1254 domain-containing protein [Ignavibacteria bacterium]|nr:DUF1254 domain-containing protein [Ignavibacteria bacterium]
MKKTLPFLIAVCFLFSSCGSKDDKTQTDNKDKSSKTNDSATIKTAEEAFLYCYSLVIMDITRRKLTNTETPNENAAPINQFANKSSFPDYTFKDVVRPNADTYYSSAFCDLGKDALVLSLPNTNDRYYLMPMLDAYSNVFSSPGKRTTGTEAGNYLITGPKWNGTVPEGIKEQIKAPTDIIWILGRIQCNGKEDGEKVVIPIQKKLKLIPLSSWGKEYTEPKGVVDPTVPKDDPNNTVLNMPIDEFFNYANKLMVNNPPAPADKPALEAFAKIGVGPNAKFDLSKFDAATQTAMKNIAKNVYAAFDKQLAKPEKLINGWNILIKGMGSYGTDYGMRSLVTYVGLGANLPQDAVYPSNSLDQDGKPYNGANKYVIHFDKGQTPPVDGFWSLTMYDQNGYFIENPINTYAIGHGPPFKYNADGSVDIYIQNESPGKDLQNNWLPAPKGDFNVMMRLYWPKETMINGTWTPPAIKKQ